MKTQTQTQPSISTAMGTTNLIVFALKQKLGESVNVDAVMQILEATGNPVVAAELFLGIYNQPNVLGQESVFHNDEFKETNIQFVSFDKFTDMIHYTCNIIDTKVAWFPKATPEEDLTIDNIVSEANYAEYAANDLLIPTAEFNELYERVIYERTPRVSTTDRQLSLGNWNHMISKSNLISAFKSN